MYTQKKSIDNIHIVRERDRQRFRELLAVLSLGIPIGLFVIVSAFVLTAIYVSKANSKYDALIRRIVEGA